MFRYLAGPGLRRPRVSAVCGFAALFGVIGPVPSPGAPALTLRQAVTLAVARAPQVQAARARQDAATADLDRAGRWPDPRLSFGIQNLAISGPGAFSPAGDPMTMRTIELSQAIPSGASLDASLAGARAATAGADAGMAQARLDTRQAAASSWVAAWASEQELQQLVRLRRQDDLAIRTAKARLAGGTGSVADVLAAEAAAAELANRIDRADAAVASARATLARWVGSPAAQRPLDHAPDFSRLPVTAARLLQGTEAQAPLQAWTARVDRAEAALQAARASREPDWSVALGYGARAPGLPRMATLVVGLRLPLFAAHREDQDVLARRADLDAIRAERENARRAQVAAVQRALAAWEADGRTVRRDRSTLLHLASDRSAVALAAYRGGAPLQSWLDARRDEIAVRLDYVAQLARWGERWSELAYLLPEDAR